MGGNVRRFAALTLLLALWLSACSASGASPQALQQEAVRVLALSGDEQVRDKEALALLDKALQQDPRHVPSLLTRAGLRMRQRDYSGALADNEAAIRIRGETPELAMMSCMLRESLGADAPLPCYARVVGLYQRELPLCQENLNCVISALMADLPEAPTYREHFLARDRSAADQAVVDNLLREFHRTTFLRAVLP